MRPFGIRLLKAAQLEREHRAMQEVQARHDLGYPPLNRLEHSTRNPGSVQDDYADLANLTALRPGETLEQCVDRLRSDEA